MSSFSDSRSTHGAHVQPRHTADHHIDNRIDNSYCCCSTEDHQNFDTMWTTTLHSLGQLLAKPHPHRPCIAHQPLAWCFRTHPSPRPITTKPPTYTTTHRFTAADIAAFTALTGDLNPLHKGPGAIVPGLLLASLFPGIIGSTFPGAVYTKQTLRFRNPAKVCRLWHGNRAHVRNRSIKPWLHTSPPGDHAVPGRCLQHAVCCKIATK